MLGDRPKPKKKKKTDRGQDPESVQTFLNNDDGDDFGNSIFSF